MKRFLFSLILVFILTIPSFAAPQDYSIWDDTSWADIPAIEPDSELADFSQSQIVIQFPPSSVDEDYTFVDAQIMPLYSLDNGTTPINSGLRSVVRSLIGNYSPVVVQYQYTNGTNTQYLREILPDYEWMFSCGVFALVLYCTFRMGGAFLSKL